MTYLTYEDYKNMGGILDSAAFNRYFDRACGVIDNATHNRLQNMTLDSNITVEFDVKYGKNVIDIPIEDILADVETRVKALCRDLVEYFANNENINEKSITSKSESAGVISQSVSYATKSKQDMQSDIDDMIYDYLAGIKDKNGTPILYRGCMR